MMILRIFLMLKAVNSTILRDPIFAKYVLQAFGESLMFPKCL